MANEVMFRNPIINDGRVIIIIKNFPIPDVDIVIEYAKELMSI